MWQIRGKVPALVVIRAGVSERPGIGCTARHTFAESVRHRPSEVDKLIRQARGLRGRSERLTIAKLGVESKISQPTFYCWRETGKALRCCRTGVGVRRIE